MRRGQIAFVVKPLAVLGVAYLVWSVVPRSVGLDFHIHDTYDRAIDVLVGRLRRKLEAGAKKPRLIRTIRGEGYRLTARVHWTATPE